MKLRPKILIVDDKIENLIALETLLSNRHDVDFIRALSGNEALAMTLKYDFALALIDVQMPGMDGFETVELMRLAEKTRHLPVIFISAVYRETYYQIKGIEKGAVDFVTKPMIPEILSGKVRVFIDLYKQKKELEETIQDLEEAREAAEIGNLVKTEFIANMSHELRTPIHIILGFADMLDFQITDPVQKRYIETIKSGGKNLLSLVNDILDLSKIEAGKIKINREYIDIRSIFNEIKQVFSVEVSRKELEFTITISNDIPSQLFLDTIRLRQTLFNLVGNAVKFTKTGYIKIKVYPLEKKDFDNNHECVDLKIAVEDTGIGIPSKLQKEIFDIFRQQDNRLSREYEGIGIGLAIVKRLVRMMNGSISLCSEPGKGSMFEIHLCDVLMYK